MIFTNNYPTDVLRVCEIKDRSPSYGVYISQLIRFARVCYNVDDFNNRNLFLTSKLLKQGYRYHKIRKAFSKFYHRHSELIIKYNIGLKTLLLQGISEPIFYGDLVYKGPVSIRPVSRPLWISFKLCVI